MKILVMGGSRFFGKYIIDNLLSRNIDVTILNRGNNKDHFGNRVKRIRADRCNYNEMQNALLDTKFDIVIDQICYTPIDAQLSAKLFAGHIGRYIMTSTIAVYPGFTFDTSPLPLDHVREEEFNPSDYKYNFDLPWDESDFLKSGKNYAEGKRQAESVFHQQNSFPMTMVRLPYVLGGHDDHTGRFPLLITKIKNEEPLVIHDNPQKGSFITRDDAAAFFTWLVEQDIHGPINAASFEQLSIKELGLELGRILNKEPIFMPSSQGPYVPYSFDIKFSISTQKARKHGFQFESLNQGLKKIVENYNV